jgi:thiol-disulfide isomerase/thioredoxin
MTQTVRHFVFAVLFALCALPATAAELVLKDVAGASHAVSEYIGRGKWTVVTVWSADCPICRRDIYHMAFFHAEHRNKDATVLGLSIDGFENRRKAAAFIEEQGLDFPNLIGGIDDPTRLTGRPFIGTPTYYVYTPEGRLVAERIGPVTQDQMEELIQDLGKKRPKGG